ncbi:MAG TPA: aminotransferase class V-fold PLP-dependent enzyme [Mycobacteriales bacterium]|jgi:kynureninase|nr:aminotransferase class V-fold PLP-dependent enzyme [Mycobacteriales bacterium]
MTTVAAVPHADLLARRVDYPILERSTAYLVNNSLGAMHRETRDRLVQFADEWATQGAGAWATWFPKMTDVADLVGQAIGAVPGTTVLRASVADALVAVASAMDFHPARNRVVTTAADWPGSHYFWTEHCRRQGGELVVVPFEPDGVTIDAQRVADAVDDKTAVVSVSLVQFRTSAVLDVDPVQAAARQHGAVLVLDAYQAAGIYPVEMSARGIDVCLGGSVKYLCGGPGNGWLSIRPDLAETLRPSAVGWISHERPFDFVWDEIEYAPGVARFTGGTPNTPAAYAAIPGYQAVVDVGIDRIRERSMGLTQLIVEDALDRGFTVVSPHDAQRRGGHVTVDPGDSQRVHDELIARGYGVDHRPGSGIRIGPHFFSTEEECHAVLEEMSRIRDGH